MNADNKIIQVNGLYKDFDKDKILKGVDLSVERGDVISIIGPSGCGKSTLLKCINRLISPSGGEILFNGQYLYKNDSYSLKQQLNLMDKSSVEYNSLKKEIYNVSKSEKKLEKEILKHLDDYRKKIGMVFQNFNLFPHKTILDNIIMAPMALKKLSREEAVENAHDLLKRINLEDKANCYPSILSGGQKQRIAIVRALAMNPEIMLFDEPTSALDPEMVKEVLNVVTALAKSGMTMIIVTHEINFAKNTSNKIAFMDEGRVRKIGTPKEILEDPDDERIREFLSKIE